MTNKRVRSLRTELAPISLVASLFAAVACGSSASAPVAPGNGSGSNTGSGGSNNNTGGTGTSGSGSGGTGQGGASTGGSTGDGGSGDSSGTGGSVGGEWPMTVTPNRDSAIVTVTPIGGAKDYRIFAMRNGVTLTDNADGTETVNGATIFCAGHEQHGAPIDPAFPDNKVMLKLEALGITGPTEFVVEALDRDCAFTGIVGTASQKFGIQPDQGSDAGNDYPMVTEAQVRAAHGSLILNGQGWKKIINNPAPPDPPKVLKRTTITITPKGTSTKPLAFFDDFSDVNDTFKYIDTYKDRQNQGDGIHLTNSKWNFYSYGFDEEWFTKGSKQQLLTWNHDGQLTTYIAQQEAFGTNMLVPKRAVQISDAKYLHFTFETTTNATDRRYWWFTVCGPATAGTAFDANGNMKGRMQMTPFFYEPDGLSPYADGWNCLQVFPFEGGYNALAPFNSKPEAHLRIIVNKATEGQPMNRDNVRNVSPNQYDPKDKAPSCAWCGWYRTWDANHKLNGYMFDEILHTAPRTKFDIYVRRDRVVVYAADQIKACNDFPQAKLTMAEGVVGLGHVLYHASAEHTEFTRPDWIRTAQRAVRFINPWVDVRNWDNVGFEENVTDLPPGFDERLCYVSDKAW